MNQISLPIRLNSIRTEGFLFNSSLIISSQVFNHSLFSDVSGNSDFLMESSTFIKYTYHNNIGLSR